MVKKKLKITLELSELTWEELCAKSITMVEMASDEEELGNKYAEFRAECAEEFNRELIRKLGADRFHRLQARAQERAKEELDRYLKQGEGK